MVKYSVGEAFSAGIGLAMGLSMAQNLSQIMKPQEKTLKQIIICTKCGGKNPSQNKFCGHCGQALYPPPPIQCPRCGVAMRFDMKYCGRCGSPLKKTEKTRKKRS